MRSVFNKSEYGRLRHRPIRIIQLLMDDIKCCIERITKGYCSKDVDNIDIWFLNIIPDMLQSLMDKKMGVPKEIYDNYENMENGIDAAADEWEKILEKMIREFREADEEKCSKHNVLEYQDEDEYLLKEKEIAKYRDECKDDAFVLFSKYFFDLWI